MRALIVVAILSVAVVAQGSVSPPHDPPASGAAPSLSPVTRQPLLVADHDDHDHHGDHGEHHAEEHEHRGHDHDRGWGPRPGWHSSWHYDHGYHPHWYGPHVVFPGFLWLNVNPGVWQCTAYNQYDRYLAPYSYVAESQDQAAYGALYDCGGPDYQASGCYIPPGYCQRR